MLAARSAGVRVEVIACPEGDLFERRHERTATIGQSVGDGDRWPFVDGARDEPAGGKVGQPVREHGVADPVDGPRQFPKTGGAGAQVPQNHGIPSFAEELEGARERLGAGHARVDGDGGGSGVGCSDAASVERLVTRFQEVAMIAVSPSNSWTASM